MTGPEGGDRLAWSVRPAATRPGRGALGVVTVLAVAGGTFFLAGPFLGGLAILLLGGSIAPYFVTARYELTPEDVAVDSPFQRVRRPWTDIRRVYVGKDGVSLSPFRRYHVLEPYRSIMLRYGEHREEILDWVRRFGPNTPAEAR